MPSEPLKQRRVGVDRFYTALSIGIAPDQPLIGDLVLPSLPIDISTVLLPKHGTEAWTIIDDIVGDHAKPKRLEVSIDKITVNVDGHALSAPVSDREQQESLRGPAAFDLEAEAIYTVKQAMLLRREKLQADLVQNSTVYPVAQVIDLTATKWDAVNDPIAALTPHITRTLPRAVGRRPNLFWMGSEVWAAFIANSAVKNRVFGSTNPQGVPTEQQVANLLNIEKVLVGMAVSRSGSTVTDLWGKKAGLVYVPKQSGRKIPSFGYTIEQRVFGSSPEAVVKIRDEEMGASGGDIMKRSAFYSPVITFGDAGVLFTNVIS